MLIQPSEQSNRAYGSGYEMGRSEGYERGKRDGFDKGCQDAIALQSAKHLEPSAQLHNESVPTSQLLDTLNENPELKAEINAELIKIIWNELNVSNELVNYFDHPAMLIAEQSERLKNTAKSCIWKLNIRIQDEIKPIILKVIKAKDKVREQSQVELNMYIKANIIFEGSMPDIYFTHIVQDDTWIFMEFIKPLEGQLSFHPNYFDNIIPALAKMHSLTFNERFFNYEEHFMPWLPIYNTTPKCLEKEKIMNETIDLLKTASKHPELEHLIKPYYKQLKNIVLKGPYYFPVLNDAGCSIIHADLQMGNIGCNDVSANMPWQIKFIDWEGAEFKPCWMDMANLVGVFLSYRTDWQEEEQQIITRCAHLYADEMKKHGIHFAEDPVELYKMADVQRVLELGLFQQLRWALDKSYKGVLLNTSIPKVIAWSQELGLYDE